MTTQRQTQTTTRTTDAPPKKSLLDTVLEQKVEYVPFMGREPIVLNGYTVLEFFAQPTKRGAKCPPYQAVRFAKMCHSRGLNPWEGDAYIVGFDGQDGPEFSIITAYQALVKRAEVHPDYDGIESGIVCRDAHGNLEDIPGTIIPDGYKLVGGWARVHSKSKSTPNYQRLDLATYDKKRSRWNADKAGMITKCAKAAAMRESFPTSVGGMYLREELGDDDHEERAPVAMPRATHEAPVTGRVITPATTPQDAQDEPFVEDVDETPPDAGTPQAANQDADEVNPSQEFELQIAAAIEEGDRDGLDTLARLVNESGDITDGDREFHLQTIAKAIKRLRATAH